MPEGAARGRGRAYADAALAAELDRLRAATAGERNSTLNACAFKLGQLVPPGLLDEAVVVADLTATALTIGLGEMEIRATIHSGLRAGRLAPRDLVQLAGMAGAASAPALTATAALATPAPEDPLTRELAVIGETDTDNAQRLARRVRGRLLCTPGRDFLAYDGKRWRADDQLTRGKLAAEAVRRIADEAAYLAGPAERAARVRYSQASLSKGGLDRMTELARPHLMIEDAALDADPWLINVANGTVNLRTGELGPHDPAQHLTRLAPVAYDPAAACPTFEAFLDRALGGDAELVAYIQKAAGLTLTGLTTEHVFFFLFGPGRTGKSTFVNTVRDLLGDYGAHTPTETFLAKTYDTNSADLASLAGARMVTAVEANWNRQIDEAKLKAATGGDPISARLLYKNPSTYAPQFKLWFVSNDLPGVRGTAEAFWSRVRIIPFEVVIPDAERDRYLGAKLKAEWPGVLAWAVRGCLAWQREGLGLPEAVQRANKGWKVKADHLRRFISEEIIYATGNLLASHDLYGRYRTWCETHGETALDDKRLKAAFEGADMTYARKRTGSFWVGVKLRLDG